MTSLNKKKQISNYLDNIDNERLNALYNFIKPKIEAVVWYKSNEINLGKEFKIKLTEVLKLVCSNPCYFQIKHGSFREVKIKNFCS